MTTETQQKPKSEVEVGVAAFIQMHLAKLCGEIIHWHKTGKLPEGAVFHELAEMHSQAKPDGGRNDDSYQIVELLVTRAALKATAATTTD